MNTLISYHDLQTGIVGLLEDDESSRNFLS